MVLSAHYEIPKYSETWFSRNFVVLHYLTVQRQVHTLSQLLDAPTSRKGCHFPEDVSHQSQGNATCMTQATLGRD